MGKSITYSAQSTFTEYPFRIRAKVDNPGDPRIATNFASDWAVDDPAAIVEQGSNANGSYVLYASGYKTQTPKASITQNAGGTSFPVIFPIYFSDLNSINYMLTLQPTTVVQEIVNSLMAGTLTFSGLSIIWADRLTVTRNQTRVVSGTISGF